MFIISDQRKKILTIIIAIILFLFGIFVGYFLFSKIKGNGGGGGSFLPPASTEDKDIITVTNTHQVRPKTSLTSPDVTIRQPEVVVQLPNKGIVKVPQGHTLDNKTQLDLTPVIKEMASERYKRNWEVGAGVGYNKERHSVYYPIAVQRNFSYDRAIEAIVGVDKHGVQNVSVVYKVKF